MHNSLGVAGGPCKIFFGISGNQYIFLELTGISFVWNFDAIDLVWPEALAKNFLGFQGIHFFALS